MSDTHPAMLRIRQLEAVLEYLREENNKLHTKNAELRQQLADCHVMLKRVLESGAVKPIDNVLDLRARQLLTKQNGFGSPLRDAATAASLAHQSKESK